MATRYAREKGRSYGRFVPHNMPDLLEAMRHARASNPASAYHQNQYMPMRQRAYRPVLGQQRMIEAAIRCSVAADAAVAAWRQAVRA